MPEIDATGATVSATAVPAMATVSATAAATVPAQELGATVEGLLARGARHVMLVGLDLRGLDPIGGLAVEEVMGLPDGSVVRLRSALPAGAPRYPSLTPLLPAAQWDEREARDLFGIVPEGHPDLRPLVVHEPTSEQALSLLKVPLPVGGWGSGGSGPSGSGGASGSGSSGGPGVRAEPRRFHPFVAHGDGVSELPVGPIHAGIIEPGHFRFSTVGESVLYLDARLFYTHRGVERLVEGRTFAAALPVIERACGVCGVTHATAFSHAVEELTGTEAPPRARVARVILAELERLYNHVGDLGNICAGVGFHFGTSRLGWQKERLLRLNEALTGHRYLCGAVAPGGLKRDLDGAVLAEVEAGVESIGRDVRAAVRLLVRSDSFMRRLHGPGTVTLQDADRLGAVGVAARASGLAQDLRADRPYDGYRGLDLQPVTATGGDVAARFHVRAQEIQASIGLIRQALGNLPDGPARVPLAASPEPGLSTVAGVEGPRGASWIWLMAGPDGRIERLRLRSGSYANWPVVAAAVPGTLVPDFPLINKSFELCYACTDR